MKSVKGVAIAALGILFIFAVLASAQPTSSAAPMSKPPVSNEKVSKPPITKERIPAPPIAKEEAPMPPMTASKMPMPAVTASKISMMPMSDSMRLEHHVAMMKDNLGLSDTQAQKIKTILEKQNKELTAEHEKYNADPKGMQQAKTEMYNSTQNEIKAVLTKEQLQKYEQMGKGMPGLNKQWKKNEGAKKSEIKQK